MCINIIINVNQTCCRRRVPNVSGVDGKSGFIIK